jgi:hypothetical protein
MPQVPLCCKLLDELDDVNRSFKCAHLSKYLQDMTVKSFVPLLDLSSDSDSDTSSISSISSISSVLSFDSDDKASIHLSLSLSFLDIEEMYFLAVQAQHDKRRQEILTTRVLHKNPAVKKASQLPLLDHWCTGNIDQYRRRVHVDPDTSI